MIWRWLPWLLVAGAFALFALAPDANGPALVGIWAAIVLGYRIVASLMPSRGRRLGLDALVALGCALAAFEGGWYVLPAVVTFAAADWHASWPVAPPPDIKT